jgi:dipeptidyl aminopeptidase/acylaminoacyl peptidase
MTKKITIVISSLLIVLLLGGVIYHQTLSRLYQGFLSYQSDKMRAQFYLLDDGKQIQDITQKLISDKSTPSYLKEPLIKGERRVLIFKYLSNSDYVAGYFSYVINDEHPLMIFLRGGNGSFGIMRPNNRFSFLKGYNVVGTLYRGNIYKGNDEFGGTDVQDVENLIKFLPQLEKFTHKKFQVPFGIMGVSRGAMEMFASLGQSAYVKSKVSHAISVSGNVDLNTSVNKRLEMKYLYMNKFRSSNVDNFDTWIKMRNPTDNTKNFSKSLKILLAYGLADNIVSLEEQQKFKKALDIQGIASQLITIPGADHGLLNHYDEFETIALNFMKS